MGNTYRDATMACKGSLHPHGHTKEHEGPWSLRIGVKSQPVVIRDWKSKTVLLSIQQPNKEDNFTLIRVMYLKSGTRKPTVVSGCKFHRARWCLKNDGTLEVKLKKKFGNSLLHPVPIGKYDGWCAYDTNNTFVVFAFQAVTLKTAPESSSVILTPGDTEYGVTLKNAEKSFSRNDGVDRGGVDAGGFCDG